MGLSIGVYSTTAKYMEESIHKSFDIKYTLSESLQKIVRVALHRF